MFETRRIPGGGVCGASVGESAIGRRVSGIDAIDAS